MWTGPVRELSLVCKRCRLRGRGWPRWAWRAGAECAGRWAGRAPCLEPWTPGLRQAPREPRVAGDHGGRCSADSVSRGAGGCAGSRERLLIERGPRPRPKLPALCSGRGQPHRLRPVRRAPEDASGQGRLRGRALLQPRPKGERGARVPGRARPGGVTAAPGTSEVVTRQGESGPGSRAPRRRVTPESACRAGEPLQQETGPRAAAHRPAPVQAGAPAAVPGDARRASGRGELAGPFCLPGMARTF